MSYNEKLVQKIRAALSNLQKVEEKKMFSGLTFMVNGKMCISVSKNRIMCRINPELHDTVVKRKGCRTVEMGNRKFKGYVYINEDNIKSKKI
jgi:TfoX/Sxy family transcriptional regulator of competence genes